MKQGGYISSRVKSYNGDLCARLKPGFLKLDIDDFDHRTNELDEPYQR